MDEKPDLSQPKHLIVLIDGTWNSAAWGRTGDLTNIFRLNHALDLDDASGLPQFTIYIPGPGTRGLLDRLPGGAFGSGLDEIILEAYVNLAANYNEGKDKIYIFGFSRGAVAARALSGMISKCGLLYSRSVDRLWLVWKHFLRGVNDPGYMDRNDEYLNDPFQIEMVGLFDSVLGRRHSKSTVLSKLRFSDLKLGEMVKTGVHILSIDDNRARFAPIPWTGAKAGQQLEQIWMPGVHGDVGGCSGEQSSRFLSTVAFLTMVERIRLYTDLSFDEDYLQAARDSVRYLDEIGISNERKNRFMRRLAYAHRSPVSGYAEHSAAKNPAGEMIHPVYYMLQGQVIKIRGSYRRYNPLYFDLYANRLTKYQTPDEELFGDVCNRCTTSMEGNFHARRAAINAWLARKRRKEQASVAPTLNVSTPIDLSRASGPDTQ